MCQISQCLDPAARRAGDRAHLCMGESVWKTGRQMPGRALDSLSLLICVWIWLEPFPGGLLESQTHSVARGELWAVKFCGLWSLRSR